MAPEDDPSSNKDLDAKPASADVLHDGEPERRETLALDEGDDTIATPPTFDIRADSPARGRLEDDIATRHFGATEDAASEVPPSYKPDHAPPPSPLKPGDVFLGKYQIESMIGAGGMGSVVLARHRDLGTLYAIKVMHAGVPDRASVDRFKREARTSAMVEHANIVRVFDCGEHAGHCYIIMEYLRGENLRKRLGRVNRFTVEEAVRFAGVVCDVLEVMHEAGIVHRDLKPDNIVFSIDGKGETVKILDFGIAKLATASASGHLTETGTVIGTPAYMSPEQCMAGKIDGRSDIYALGVILFQMLTGRLPFESDNLLTMMYLHVNQAPPAAKDWNPSVPSAVSDVVGRMMAKEPAERYQSATSCAAALSEAAGVAIPIRTGTETSAARAVADDHGIAATSDTDGSEVRPLSKASDAEPDRRVATRRSFLGFVAAGTLAIAAVAAGVVYLPGLFRSTSPGVVENTNTGTSGNKTVEKPFSDRFVEIPGGAVTVGANDGDCRDMEICKIEPEETPSHIVTLAPYWIAKHEVTNQEYAEFVSATGRKPPTNWRGSFPRGTDALPVTNVSWNDAVAYADWLSKRDGASYRLPTEEEWEHAARGDDARMFPWGDFWNANSVNSDHQSDTGSPLPVDQAPNSTTDVTPRGVTALAGNVCEWTSSKFEAYPGSPYKPTQGDLACKVFRGGSFYTKPNASRASYRAWQLPDNVARDIGFRLAADPSLTTTPSR